MVRCEDNTDLINMHVAFNSSNKYGMKVLTFPPGLCGRSKHIKDSKERLFIITQTHSLQSFVVTPSSSYKTIPKQLNGYS